MKQEDDANFPEMIALFFYAAIAAVLQNFPLHTVVSSFHTNT